MSFTLSLENERLFRTVTAEVCRDSRLRDSTHYMQHGQTSVYQHSVAVAYLACLLAEKWRVRVDFPSLIRAGLLHDYFLYDWHEKSTEHRLHGFTHPGTALKNAMALFSLNETERDVIARHMFPLTLLPPRTREGWLVQLADKICAVWETTRLAGTALYLIPVYR